MLGTRCLPHLAPSPDIKWTCGRHNSNLSQIERACRLYFVPALLNAYLIRPLLHGLQLHKLVVICVVQPLTTFNLTRKLFVFEFLVAEKLVIVLFVVSIAVFRGVRRRVVNYTTAHFMYILYLTACVA